MLISLMGRFYPLSKLRAQFVIAGKAAGGDIAAIDRSAQCAVGFPVVMAVAKTALAQKWLELGEARFQRRQGEMSQTKFLQAGRVDQV
jgi:hypothetical protein